MTETAISDTGRPLISAGLILYDGRVLLCLRSLRRKWYPGVWDLPGGHVEEGETPQAALVRELREELGIRIEEPSGADLTRLVASDFEMSVWTIRRWIGTPSNAAPYEHDEIAWYSPAEVESLSLAHPNYLGLITDAVDSTIVRPIIPRN